MKAKTLTIAVIATVLAVGSQCMSWAALSLEGQTGIFLNGLA